MKPNNFNKVNKMLYRGAAPSKTNLKFLKEIGIKKIVSLDGEIANEISDFCKKLGFKHEILNLENGNDPKIKILQKKIIPKLTDEGPTYLHCYYGKDRTSMCIAMYRILNGWSKKEAILEAQKFKMGLNVKDGDSYYKAVLDYEPEKDDISNNFDNFSSPAINNMLITNFGLHGSPSIMSSQASYKIYCKCKKENLKNSKQIWYSNIENAVKNGSKNGILFSAKISSKADVEKFDDELNKNTWLEILKKDKDVAVFQNNVYIIMYPDILINIKEENDKNDSFPGLVGSKDSYLSGNSDSYNLRTGNDFIGRNFFW